MIVNIFIASIIGSFAIFLSLLAPHQKIKKKVLVLELSSTLLFVLQYLFLGAFSAVGTNLVGVVRDYMFYNYTEKERNIPILIFIIYVLIVLLIGIFTYDGLFSLFPILLSILTTYSLWQNNLTVYRVITLINCIIWSIYNFIVSAFINAIFNLVYLISVIFAIARIDIKMLKK